MVHEIILEQLGGRRFLAMTGSHNLTYDSNQPNYLMMHLRRNKLGAQYLKITLNGLDLYDLEFSKQETRELAPGIRVPSGIKTTKTVENIYCDQLQEIFTRETGLYTHL